MLLHLHGIISLYVVVCTYNMYIALTVELAISSPPKQQQLCVYILFLYSFRGFVLIQYCNTKGERKPLLSCAFMMKAVQIVVWCDKKNYIGMSIGDVMYYTAKISGLLGPDKL